MPHRSTYLQGPPGRDQPAVSARYGLQMASVPSSYDAAAAVAAAAAFHAQSYPPVSIPHGILIDAGYLLPLYCGLCVYKHMSFSF